jgi:uncharacterized protein (DUF433 family)
MKTRKVKEIHGGSAYEYLPLGKHVVSAPAICRGRPTFKYTRIEVAGVLERLAAGHSVSDLIAGYGGRVSHDAIQEAAALAARALAAQTSRPARRT